MLNEKIVEIPSHEAKFGIDPVLDDLFEFPEHASLFVYFSLAILRTTTFHVSSMWS